MKTQTTAKDVPDFRINRRKKHNLLDILVISVCACVYGADDFEDIALYGTQKEVFLRTFLELPHGIPSHDTFYRVLKFLDKEAFADSLYRWSKEILSTLNEQYTQINIGGKVLRATAKMIPVNLFTLRGKQTASKLSACKWYDTKLKSFY